MRVVLDASMALAAVLPDERSDRARAAMEIAVSGGLVVPALWSYEIQNGLISALRRKRIDEETAAAALALLSELTAMVEPSRKFGAEFEIAKSHALSAYDAAYISVALATGAILATFDLALQRAARTLGITLF